VVKPEPNASCPRCLSPVLELPVEGETRRVQLDLRAPVYDVLTQRADGTRFARRSLNAFADHDATCPKPEGGVRPNYRRTGMYPGVPCRGCSSLIRFTKDEQEKSIPLDPFAPVYRIDDPPTIAQRSSIAMVTHFSTCPNANQFSKPRRTRAS
jgi:hypothetical protein